mmetsp:Transcript_538/g.2207  ORF Transcript_538/g.2207 Transcript_538/m.2207 type:complete len:299 (-) Transcript_538:918-1814(-)
MRARLAHQRHAHAPPLRQSLQERQVVAPFMEVRGKYARPALRRRLPGGRVASRRPLPRRPVRGIRGVDLEQVPPRGCLVVPGRLRDPFHHELDAPAPQQLPPPARVARQRGVPTNPSKQPSRRLHVPLDQHREQLLARAPRFPLAVRLHERLKPRDVRPAPPSHLPKRVKPVVPVVVLVDDPLDVGSLAQRLLRVPRLSRVPPRGVPKAPCVPVRGVRALANLVQPPLVRSRVERALALAVSFDASLLGAAQAASADVGLNLALPATVVLATHASRALVERLDRRVRWGREEPVEALG